MLCPAIHVMAPDDSQSLEVGRFISILNRRLVHSLRIATFATPATHVKTPFPMDSQFRDGHVFFQYFGGRNRLTSQNFAKFLTTNTLFCT